jgi:uncharacterized membrane protein
LNLPENAFAALAVVFGILFVFINPPCVVYDETNHLFRSFDLSEGRLIPPATEAGWGAGEQPSSFLDAIQLSAGARSGHKVHSAPLRHIWSAPLSPDQRTHMVYVNTVPNSFVPYLLPALGLGAARGCGAGVMAVFCAGRIANLLASVAMIWLAIRLTPVFKHVLMALALMPSSVCLFASISSDPPLIASTFLLIALFLRWSVSPEVPLSRAGVLAVPLLSAVVGLCKFPYAAVALLLLAVPRRFFGSTIRYLGMVAIVFGCAGLPAAAWLYVGRDYAPSTHVVPGWQCTPRAQLEFVLSKPHRTLESMLNTVDELGHHWLMGMPYPPCEGSVPFRPDHSYCQFVFVGFLVFLAGLATVEPMQSGRRKWIAAVGTFAGLLATGLVLLSMYLWWTPVGGGRVEGIQPRYFIPLMPLFLLPFSLCWRHAPVEACRLTRITMVASGYLLGLSTIALVRDYYIKEKIGLLSGPCMAILVAVGIAAVARFRARSGKPPDQAGARNALAWVKSLNEWCEKSESTRTADVT